MFMIMAVTVATAATIMIVVVPMIVAVSSVYMTVLQLFRRCFTQGDNFHVELQVLTSQHVVTVDNNVFVTNFGDFYRYRTLVGFSQEAHANLQFVNAHENVFRNALNQVFVILAVRVIRADFDIKFVAHFVAV